MLWNCYSLIHLTRFSNAVATKRCANRVVKPRFCSASVKKKCNNTTALTVKAEWIAISCISNFLDFSHRLLIAVIVVVRVQFHHNLHRLPDFWLGVGIFCIFVLISPFFFKILLRTQFELSAKISKGFFACVFYYSFIIVFTTVVLSVSLVACNSSSMLFVSTLFFDFWPRIYGYIQRCCYFCFIYTQTNTYTQTVCNVILHFFSGLQWFFRITKSIFFKLTEVNLITFRVCEKFIHLSVYTQYYCGL